jgi:hypothetical protein
MESSHRSIFVSGYLVTKFADVSVGGGDTLPLIERYRRTRGIDDEKKFPLRYTSAATV